MAVNSLDDCEAIAPACIAKIISGKKLPKGGAIWRIGNELRPSDLYAYLHSKFGPPNGLQNLFRKDESDNLIHWDWTLAHENGLIMILGLNHRTEVHLLGSWLGTDEERLQFVDGVKADFSTYGKAMSSLKKEHLEDWIMFVNPYQNLQSAVLQLLNDLKGLRLDPSKEQLDNPTTAEEFQAFGDKWQELMARYTRGTGLAMALRMMIPVLAESFVNFVLFVLCRSDIRSNPRLYEAALRANIDVRVQSLHINCVGFKAPIDWSAPECGKYNSIVNERNDTLHGNVRPDKMKFAEIFFNGKVPVFKNYETMWQRSIGVSLEAAGVEQVYDDLAVVEGFINHVKECMTPEIAQQIDIMSGKRDLGLNKKTGRLGVLLPDHLVDFAAGPAEEDGSSSGANK